MRLIYVTRPTVEPLESDPLADLVASSCVHVIKVPDDMIDTEILTSILQLIDDVGSEQPIVVIVDVFLGLASSSVTTETAWRPTALELASLLDPLAGVSSRTNALLLSLRLVWKLWAVAGRRVRILASTDGIRIHPRFRVALSDAFGEGRICLLYDWAATRRERYGLLGLTSTDMNQGGVS